MRKEGLESRTGFGEKEFGQGEGERDEHIKLLEVIHFLKKDLF